MVGRFLTFIKYHNALPIGVAVLLLSTGGAFAASPELRDAVLSSREVLTSVDNSYIRDADLESFSPRVEVTEVTEDDDAYYVSYQLETIGLADGSWQPLAINKTMNVSKTALGERDLGLYVTNELGQLVDRELARLKETQEIERKSGVRQKVVATAYSGLVGKFLDAKEETFEGYEPVKPPPAPPVVSEEKPSEQQQNPSSDIASVSKPQTTSSSNSSVNKAGAPTFQILGANPARVPLRARWSDLGAYVTDDKDAGIGYKTIGADAVDVDTVGEYTITYRAVDNDGNVGEATRTVIVYDPNPPKEDNTATTTAATTTVESATADEEPQQETVIDTEPSQSPEPAPVEEAAPVTDTSTTTSE